MMAQRDDWRQQAKNSLNVRNYQDTVKRFYGDAKLAAAYLPLAQSILGDVINRTTLGGIEEGSRTVQVKDGTVIRVIRNGDIRIIEIDTKMRGIAESSVLAIYMESGLIYMTQSGLSDQFQPKNDVQETDSTAIADKFKDSITLKRIIDSVEMTANVEIQRLYTDRSHAIPGGYLDKRYTYPVSLLATGKLRTVLQAKLGRANPNYRVPEEGNPNAGVQSKINQSTKADMWKFIAGPHAYEGLEYLFRVMFNTHGKAQSFGLFSSGDYSYYFIEIHSHTSTDNLAAIGYPCTLGRHGEELKSILMADNTFSEEELRRLETYLLSDLRVDLTNYFTIGYFTVYGFPAFNGWHFNSSGSKADIVTLQPIPDDDLPLRYKHNLARHYRLTFSSIEGVIPLAVSCELLEEEPMTPWMGRDNLWIPDYTSAKMIYYYWRGIEPFTEELEFDGPIYAYYNSDDKLVMARLIFRNEEVDFDYDLIGNTSIASRGCVDGPKVEAVGEESSLTTTHGFYSTVDGVLEKEHFVSDMMGWKARYSSQAVATGQTHTSEPFYTDYFTRITPMCPADTATRDYLGSLNPSELGGYYRTIYEYLVTGTEYGATNWVLENIALAIIPWHDAETIYLGNLVLDSDSAPTVTNYGWRIGKEHIYDNTGTVPVDEVLRLQTRPSATGQQGSGLEHPPDIPTTIIPTYYLNSVGELDIYYRHGRLNAANLNYTNITETSLVWSAIEEINGWYRLAAPVLFGEAAYPYFDDNYQVSQGILDNIIYYTDPQTTVTMSYDDGYVYRGIVPPRPEFSGYLRQCSFSGWT